MKYFQLKLRERDQQDADEAMQIIARYKIDHKKRTLFEALIELLREKS